MGPFKGEVPVRPVVACAETPSHSRVPGNIWVRVSFTTGAVRSAILATAVLLVLDPIGRFATILHFSDTQTDGRTHGIGDRSVRRAL